MGDPAIVGTINQNNAFKDMLNLGESIMRNLNRHDALVRFTALWVAVTTAGRTGTFRKVGVSSGYQVPAGKAFRCMTSKTNIVGTGTTNYWGVNLGTSDVGFNSATPATGLSLTVDNPIIQNYFAASASQGSKRTIFVAPAATYIQAYNSGTSGVYAMLFGYEVDLTVTSL